MEVDYVADIRGSI